MSAQTQPRGVLLLGPTASGKTDLAMALADTRPVQLISLDSAMVYRGMDIGTAKPSPDELARYPHALVDICDPATAYSAADFVRDADLAVAAALNDGKLPLLVGGTMLYAKAFLQGLHEMPSADESIRTELSQRAEREGWPALHAQLHKVDPVAAAKIHPHNTQRLQRALEVYTATGKPMSWWWQQPSAQDVTARTGVKFTTYALLPADRAILHARIEQRFEVMLSQGFLAEVRALHARGDLSLNLPSMRAVGYRQAWEHLEGDSTAAEFSQRAVAATRQLAKRQFTWLRGWPDLVPLTPGTNAVNLALIDADLARAPTAN